MWLCENQILQNFDFFLGLLAFLCPLDNGDISQLFDKSPGSVLDTSYIWNIPRYPKYIYWVICGLYMLYDCYIVVDRLSDLYRSGMHTPRFVANICEHGITDTRTAMTATSATELQDQIHLSTACSTWANRWSDRTLVGFTCWDSQMRQSEEHRTLRKIVGNPDCQSPTIYSWKFLEALTHFDPTIKEYQRGWPSIGLSGPDGSPSQRFPVTAQCSWKLMRQFWLFKPKKNHLRSIFVDLNSLRSE